MARKWGETDSRSEKAIENLNGDEWSKERRGRVYGEINTADEICNRRS